MIGIAIAGFIGTMVGYALCAMMVVGKEADRRTGVMCPFVFDKSVCNKECKQWERCVRLHQRNHD